MKCKKRNCYQPITITIQYTHKDVFLFDRFCDEHGVDALIEAVRLDMCSATNILLKFKDDSRLVINRKIDSNDENTPT